MSAKLIFGLAALGGLVAGSVWSNIEQGQAVEQPIALHNAVIAGSPAFTLCHTGGGINCVVDGDTIWLAGEKIRVADIDAPETHPPRCPREAQLGDQATRRLRELVNAGPFEAHMIGNRDTDRYGRSLGDQLVSEGLARTWTGKRRPWC